MNEPVYQEWGHRLLPSSHGERIFYPVFLGTVNWTGRSGDEQVAFAVLMQYGEDVNRQMPAHILEADLSAVLQAIGELRATRSTATHI